MHWPRITRKRFHIARLLLWAVQMPLALAWPAMRESVPYLTIISIAALVESAATDVDQSRRDEKLAEAANTDDCQPTSSD